MLRILRSGSLAALLALIGVTSSNPASAGFLDITSLTSGNAGSFSGTLNGVGVTGTITLTTPNFVFEGPGVDSCWECSTINNTSPQFSYSNIYTPSIPLTDRVGYTSFTGTENPATITINFSSPVTNPIFDVANLDQMQYDFSATAGLGGLVLLSGNGGGDGILVVGDVIKDANPVTAIGQSAAAMPLTSGSRSAYGSVQLEGTFTSLTINVDNPRSGGDGGSFTLSVPEPATLSLLGLGLAGLGASRRRKQ
jgi:hypothetical protein